MREHFPIYAVLAIGVIAAVWWYENREPEVEDKPLMRAIPPVSGVRTRGSYWAYLPPVAYVISQRKQNGA